MSMKYTRIPELRRTNTRQIDKHTQKHRKKSIETNCRLTDNTETNVRNMSGQNVRKMPVQKMFSENSPQMHEDRRCPKLAFRNVLDMPYRPTNQKRKYALFCRWVMPEQIEASERPFLNVCA